MRFPATLLAAACALALAACGNDAPPPADSAATAPAGTATTTPADATAPVGNAGTAGAVAEGGVGTARADNGAPTAGAAAPGNGSAAVVSDCRTTIGSDDAMRYDASSLAIPASCTEFTIELVHNGQMPKAAMGHNLVIASQADMAGVLADGMAAGLDKDYVKPDDARVVAHTAVVGGGERTTVTFQVSKLQAGGPWVFFCSFPGHAALMKGTVTVE